MGRCQGFRLSCQHPNPLYRVQLRGNIIPGDAHEERVLPAFTALPAFALVPIDAAAGAALILFTSILALMKPWFVLVAFLGVVPFLSGAEVPIDPSRFQLQVEKGAEARSAIVDDEDEPGHKEIMVTVSKPGPEFWSVELRAAGFSFEEGKRYDLLFRAKSSQSEYVYFTLEKTDGNQGSIARGTTLQIPEQPVDCTVEFEVKQKAPSARVTISSLSVDQATFYFSDFKLIEK